MRLHFKDRKLLYELTENSRRPFSVIARRISMSQQLVSYKIKSHRKKGIIGGFYPMIDPARMGYITYRVFFRINYSSREGFSQLISEIAKHPTVTSIQECGGKYDVVIVFCAPNPSSFYTSLQDLIFSHPNSLKDHLVLSTVLVHNFPRKHLITTQYNTKDIVLGGHRDIVDLDDVDKRIISALSKNALAPLTDIARTAGINPKTVTSRMRALERRDIIRAYRPLLNLQAADYRVHKIFITYHNLTRQREKQLLHFCTSHPNITNLIILFGGWDAELTVETRTTQEFRNIYILLREEFQDIIKDMESFPIFRVHKLQSLPAEYFADARSNGQ